jgi:hypothetical protein
MSLASLLASDSAAPAAERDEWQVEYSEQVELLGMVPEPVG